MKYWRFIKKNKGFSLVEMLMALFIVAFVLGAMMTVFVASIHTRGAADTVTQANAVAQKFIEGQYNQNYSSVIAKTSDKFTYTNGSDTYYMSFKLQPQGTAKNNYSYVHIIYLSTGKYLLVGPDGNYKIVATNTVTVKDNSTTYSINYDSGSVSGAKPSANSVYAVVNAATTISAAVAITINTNVYGALYCSNDSLKNITLTANTSNFFTYSQSGKADQSLVRVQVSVYENATSTKKITVIESMLQLKNA